LQERIYRYLVYRQNLKLHRQAINLRHQRKLHPPPPPGSPKNHEHRNVPKTHYTTRNKMSQNQEGGAEGYGIASRLGSAWRGEGREVGSRRAKLKSYISGIKDTYGATYANLGSSFRVGEDYENGLDKAYPDDVNVTRSGDEEMVLFPSYSRIHVAEKTEEQDPNLTEGDDDGESSTGAQAIQQHWDRYEDQNAVVDVDVRGWIYTPHKGPMSRKQRLALGIARQLAGLPAPPAAASPSGTPESSRSSSPYPLRHRIEEHTTRKEQRLIDEETEHMLRTARQEADKAERGEYSEGRASRPSAPRIDRLKSEDSIEPLSHAQKRASWKIPSEMTEEERTLADSNLMNRLRSFYANPMVNTPVSAFFYNDTDSRQRTIYTNAYGQFALRAALDFVPTHVRVLASENLSAGQEIYISEAVGISVISDIDDTLKHTAMLDGAREAFRNAFLRNLEDLVVDGVHEWFNRLAEMGVQFHYVSNSPWQLFPVLSRFFNSVKLPPGSFHLKQYTGMLQGIFEPVAERKKSTMDRIARDFPDRRFILIGDSGEADLEVYLDFVRENPGRVLGIFIRDVTTPKNSGNFDHNLKVPDSGSNTPRTASNRPKSTASTTSMVEEHDPELKAAIEASLKDLEADEARRKGSASLQSKSKPSISKLGSEDLITFSDSDEDLKSHPPNPPPRKLDSEHRRESTHGKAPPPALPRKPDILRGNSTKHGIDNEQTLSNTKSPPPLPPKRSATASTQSSTNNDKPASEKRTPPAPPPPRGSVSSKKSGGVPEAEVEKISMAETTKETLELAYESLPSAPWSKDESKNSSGERTPAHEPDEAEPASTRRLITSYPTAAAQYASSRIGSAFNYYYGGEQSGSASAANNNGLTKSQNNRIEMWKRRWGQAEATLRKEGVLLRTWRVGTDAIDDSVKLVERAKKQQNESEQKS
jgi:phosphatidate phosphatase APP1